jgi:hypothetical protein
VERLAEMEAMLLEYAVLTVDRPLASQFLEILRTDGRMRTACLYDAAGKVLASWSLMSPCPPVGELGQSGHRMVGDEVQVWRSVMSHGPEGYGPEHYRLEHYGPERDGPGHFDRQVGTVFVAADRDYTATGKRSENSGP